MKRSNRAEIESEAAQLVHGACILLFEAIAVLEYDLSNEMLREAVQARDAANRAWRIHCNRLINDEYNL